MYRPPYRPWVTLLIVAGLTAGALLARYYPLSRLQSYLPARLLPFGPVLARHDCPTCTEWRHVRLVDGVVTVYYGKRDAQNPVLKERTRITAEMLMPGDRTRLEQGVDLQGDAAVRQFLEHD